jgi:hypothetical protein
MKPVVLAFLVCSAMPSGALAQDGSLHGAITRAAATTPLQAAPEPLKDSWSRVEQLDAGTKITLTYVDGRSEDRVVVGANEAKLMVRSAAGRGAAGEIIPRERIREVTVERRRHAVAGAAIGGSAGFLMGLAAPGLNGCDAGCASPAAAGAALALVGVLVGYAASPVHVVREVLYRSEK